MSRTDDEGYDVRGHFPYHKYPHPDTHTHETTVTYIPAKDRAAVIRGLNEDDRRQIAEDYATAHRLRFVSEAVLEELTRG